MWVPESLYLPGLVAAVVGVGSVCAERYRRLRRLFECLGE